MHRRQRSLAVVPLESVSAETPWGPDGERVLDALAASPVTQWTDTALQAVATTAGVTVAQVSAHLAEPGFAEELWERTRRRVLLLMPAVTAALLQDALHGEGADARSAQKLLIQLAGLSGKSGPSTVIMNQQTAAAPSMSEDELKRIIAEYPGR